MTSPYIKGRRIEYRCKEILKEKGVGVIARSSRSLGPFDLVAIFPLKKEIWLVQVKGWKKPPSKAKISREYQVLKELEGTYQVKAYAFVKRGNKYVFEPIS